MDLTISCKRARASDSMDLSPATLRKLHRSAWNQSDVSTQGMERIVDTQALRIHELESQIEILHEKMKGNEWASRELTFATDTNAQWKKQCEELQIKLRSDAATRLEREGNLQIEIADLQGYNAQLLDKQHNQEKELVDLEAQLEAARADALGVSMQQRNLDHKQNMDEAAAVSQELLSIKDYVSSLEQELESTRTLSVDWESQMKHAIQQINNQDTEMRMNMHEIQALKAQVAALKDTGAELAAVKLELTKAQQAAHGMTHTTQADEIERKELKESLRVTNATSEAQKVRLEALAKEQFRLINVEAERDELQAQLSTLQHALRDLKSISGEVDVRQVIRRYQTRELQSEKKFQQLRSELQQARQDSESYREELASAQAKTHELTRTADAASRRAEASESGQILAQSEANWLKDRLSMYMAMLAARDDGSQTSTCQEPVDSGKVHKAVADAKATHAKLMLANKEANNELRAALTAKADVERELRLAQKQMREISAQTHISGPVTAIAAQGLPHEPVHLTVGREYLEYQVDALQMENERLRQSMTQMHAKLLEMPESADAEWKSSATGLQHAELVIAQQAVEDYRVRLDKLGNFFVQNSQGFREVVNSILGWKVTFRKHIGQGYAQGIVELCLHSTGNSNRKLSVSVDEHGTYSITEIPSWLSEPGMSDILAAYNNDANLPRLLAAVQQAATMD